MSHAQIVHFPIALLMSALIFEIIGLIWPRQCWSNASLLLLVLGLTGAFFALQTGETAAATTGNIAGIDGVLNQHESSAERLFWFFMIVGFVKGALIYFKKENRRWRLLIIAGMIIGNVLIYETARLGGQLVYEWGAGVKSLRQNQESPLR